MTLEQILSLASWFQFKTLFKLFILVVSFFYFVLTLVIYRQMSLMTQILESKISPLLKTIAVFQIIGVGILFFLGVAFN